MNAYDPEAKETARQELGDRVEYAESALGAAQGADALVLVTEWNEFRNPDLAQLREALGRPIVFDGRNIWDPDTLRGAGFEYHGIGRR